MSRRKRRSRSQFSLFAFQDIITCVMGIMLLLTLMMCLQITTVVASANPTAADKTMRRMKQQASKLSGEVQATQQAINEQQALLESGAIIDPELLRQRSDALQQDKTIADAGLTELTRRHESAQLSLQNVQLAVEQTKDRPETTRQLEEQNQELKVTLERLMSGDRIVYNAHTTSAKTCWLVEMGDETAFLAAQIGKHQVPRRFTSANEVQSWIMRQHQSGAVFLLIVKPDAAAVLDELAEHLRTKNVSFGFDLLPQDKSAIDPKSGAVAL